MKILMVNKYLYAKGGAETYFLKIGRYLESEGMEVQYFGMSDPNNIVCNKSGQYTSKMDFHHKSIGTFLYPFKIIYSFQARRAIGKLIDDFKPDIIHLNNINFQITPSIIEEAYKRNVTIIQTVHDYQMLCPNHLLFNLKTLSTCELCVKGDKWNCTKYSCIHGSRIRSFIGTLEALLYKKRKTYELVNKYICPSFFMERKLMENPIYKGKTITVHNFVEKMNSLEDSVEKEDYVLYFGRLSHEKGFEMFINCCKQLNKINFVVAGTGPMEKLCEGIQNVKYVGFKTGKELNKIIRKAQFSVYPSIWYENCPLSILESESLGTPVIASKMGGIPELIEDGKTGIIIDCINETKLKDEINKLYLDKSLIAEMSANCLNKRKELLTLESYCKLLMEIYRSSLLENPRK